MENTLRQLGEKLENLGIFKKGTGRIVAKEDKVKYEAEVANHQAFVLFAKTVTRSIYKKKDKKVGGRINFTGRMAPDTNEGAKEKWAFEFVTVSVTEGKDGKYDISRLGNKEEVVNMTLKGVMKDLSYIEEQLAVITGIGVIQPELQPQPQPEPETQQSGPQPDPQIQPESEQQPQPEPKATQARKTKKAKDEEKKNEA